MTRRLDRALREQLQATGAEASWTHVRSLVSTGKVFVDGQRTLDPAASVDEGSSIEVRMAAPRPQAGGVLADSAIVHLDAHVVVVNKPAGISTVPFEDERDTLDALVRRELRRRGDAPRADAPLGVVHRIDKETSGLVVFARTLAAKRALASQFRAHSVGRRYVAIAAGDVRAATLRSRLIRDRGDGRRGSVDDARLGVEAVTHVQPLERLNGATLVECRLETGRTHQIRIQLAEAGHPLLGERVYVPRGFSALLPAPRLMLHAAELAFDHPAGGRRVRFEQEPPEDLRGVVERLRLPRG